MPPVADESAHRLAGQAAVLTDASVTYADWVTSPRSAGHPLGVQAARPGLFASRSQAQTAVFE
jgi:hypothetical protein